MTSERKLAGGGDPLSEDALTVEVSNHVGAVLVVGAGISGMQAALDLANGGYFVYLLDSEPAIGGLMSKLDKTFPTNDCAMCVMSPKLVDCGRHLNIELITCADVTGLAGSPGNYRVNVLRRARSVDETKCTGCGECVAACPSRYIVQQPGESARYNAELGEDDVEFVDRLLREEPDVEVNLLGILQTITSNYRYLPEHLLKHLADHTGIPLARLVSIGTFYSTFSLEPRGKHIIRVCLGTTCNLKGGGRIADSITDELGIANGETTSDLMFTLEQVTCLGACALAPAIMVNDKYHGKMTVMKMKKLIEQCRYSDERVEVGGAA